jgi:subtilisin family serine protease
LVSDQLGAEAAARIEGETEIMLVLEGEPVAAAVLAERRPGRLAVVDRSSSSQIAAERKAQQAALLPMIAAANGRVTGNFYKLVNAVRVRVPASGIESLRSLPGVLRIEAVPDFHRGLASSVPWIGVPSAWASTEADLTGEGVRIGILDSGIDYTHRMFGGSGSLEEHAANDPTILEPGSFPTDKVVGGHDFAGADYDSSGNLGSTTPEPDPDPIDDGESTHGTHVAGIAAGFGVLQDGRTYGGPYGSSLDFETFRIGPGVAPGARLYALKLYGAEPTGTTRLVLDGLEWAADPNQDDDLTDRLDVVNGSIAGAFGEESAEVVTTDAVNQLAALGCVVVFISGNNGNTHYMLGSPGVATRSITVANAMDGGMLAVEVTAPGSVAGLYGAIEGEFTRPLYELEPLTAPVVYVDPPDACASPGNAADLNGSLALIDRGGDCFFFHEKIRRAQQVGAVGVIMVNNRPGPPIVMGSGGGDVSDIAIPAVMISQADGDILKAALADGVVATIDISVSVRVLELADQLAETTSRGPSGADGLLKPDIAAPGSSILSAAAGTGHQGKSMGGTSMAAPHIAGAAALLKQLHPLWPVEDLKAVLMNTAAPTRTNTGALYPESLTGAGRVQVGQAMRSTVVVKAAEPSGAVSLSFGALQLVDAFATNRELLVVNHGLTAATFGISVSNTVTETGVRLEPLLTEVTVPPEGTATVPVRLEADPAQLDRSRDSFTPLEIDGRPRQALYEASGQVWFHGESGDLHVPWHVAVRAASQFSAVAARVGLPEQQEITLSLPTHGRSAHPAPVCSVFQLGATSGDRGLPAAEARGDLVAVGAASDFRVKDSVADTTVYFGLAVAGAWRTPQRAHAILDVEIDLDQDGVEDFTLSNGSGGHIASGRLDRISGNDALMTVVEDDSTRELAPGGVWNVLPPETRDPSPYHSRVLVFSASAPSVGLTAGQTQFRYRAVTYTTDWFMRDTTSWIEFDAARPAIDSTPFGLLGTPLFDEGRSLQIHIDRAAAAASGFDGANPLQLLLLHHHNLVPDQVEVVQLDLTTADADLDGLPDDWELAELGDLLGEATTDRDGDGFPEASEHAAGTGATDPVSLLRLLVTDGASLQWPSVAGKTYALERSVDLALGFQVLQGGIVANPETNTFVDPTPPEQGPAFYRVRLE